MYTSPRAQNHICYPVCRRETHRQAVRTDGWTIRLPTRTHRFFTHSPSYALNAFAVHRRRFRELSSHRVDSLFFSPFLSHPPLSCPSVLSLLSSHSFFFFFLSRGFFSPRVFFHARFSNKQKHEHGPGSGTIGARVERDEGMRCRIREGGHRRFVAGVEMVRTMHDLTSRNWPESSRVHGTPGCDDVFGGVYGREIGVAEFSDSKGGLRRENGARKPEIFHVATKATE